MASPQEISRSGPEPPLPGDLTGLSHSTGAFNLFGLPRELRDKIYSYHLYRPGGVYYTAHADKEFWYSRERSDGICNLLIVSRQVYHEAFEVFCLTNTVALSTHYNPREGYKKPLAGLLRLFPDRVASSLTRVSNTYRDIVTRPVGMFGYAPSHVSIAQGGDGTGRYQKYNSAGETFVEILRDAHSLAQYFPKLVAFEAHWDPEHTFFEHPEQQGQVHGIAYFLKQGTDEGRIVTMWLEALRGWLQGQNVVPLGCVRFTLEGFAADGFGEELDMSMNEAYRALVKERSTGEDIEDSGRLWLEEMDSEQANRRRKGKGKKKSKHA
ncbi:uncharacterized protein yc1106_02942 [Curvularia clavata]|uniref:Uncharacterized protein n=1 Tax=Curvularia clavata TaxID=95742 RepID=A0A9Q9DPX4_CURCL|nr:uncharacterized protein yc1106_02942 [Curvularia clavata]